MINFGDYWGLPVLRLIVWNAIDYMTCDWLYELQLIVGNVIDYIELNIVQPFCELEAIVLNFEACTQLKLLITWFSSLQSVAWITIHAGTLLQSVIHGNRSLILAIDDVALQSSNLIIHDFNYYHVWYCNSSDVHYWCT